MKAFYLATFFLCTSILHSQVPENETMPFFSTDGYDSADSDQNIFQYIGENVVYPFEARDNCQSGTVYIQFTIDTLGDVASDSLLFENYPLLIQASKDVIYETSGSWKPATQNGKKVNAKITLPFKFNLRGGGCHTAMDYFQYGLGAFELENYKKAALYFRQALRQEPLNADYLYNTSVSYLKMYNMDSACYYANRVHTDKDINNILIKFCDADSSIFDADSSIYVIVEEMPLFYGAKTVEETNELIFKYIDGAAKKINTKDHGTVYIQFLVDNQGNTVNPKIIRSENERLNEFAIQIIKNMPKWKPGTQRGKPVNVQYTIPIRFK